ncbi:hypothetical protein LTR67_005362 [Exophiala xenobiotica]
MRATFSHQKLRPAIRAHGYCYGPSQAQPWIHGILARNASSKVRIIEVGPRDGLQNIRTRVPTSTKVELIRKLAATGLMDIEATSFVSPKWVPQLEDGKEVMEQILPLADQNPFRFSVLAPNVKGFEGALAAGAKEIVVFASATQAFSKKNQNCTVEQALEGARVVVARAKKHGLWARGVVSCIFSDPYSGPTDPKDVLFVVKQFINMGCDEVGLGDTLGVGTPKLTQTLLEVLLRHVPSNKLTGHFHDTYGQAVANVMRSYDMGLRTFDSSIAGLGGCPYAPGAKGNAATEDIVYTLENSGIDTGVNLHKLAVVGEWIAQRLNLPNNSRAGAALLAKERQNSHSCTAETSDTKRLKPATRTSFVQPEKQPSPRTWTVSTVCDGYTVSRSTSAVKVTLTRPQNGNAMTTEMLESLTRFFRDVSTDRSIFHIVLAAEGKFFCTALFKAVDDAPQTTIAMIHGPCYGGGVGLGFACDVRLASAAARWTLSEIKLGVSPAIISKYMAREWGFSFFREAMLSGREVTPDELLRIGSVHGVAETQEKLELMVEEYLNKLTHCAPQAGATCKELVRLAFTSPGSPRQASFIRQTFDNMLAPGSEGGYGIQQFQQKIRNVDWRQFWSTRGAKL